MKTILLGLALIFSLTAFGQQYIVFSIKGEVLADGKPLQVKSMITDETNLVFKSPDGELYVMSPQKGKLIISARKAVRNEQNEFLSAVKNAILPPTQYRTTSTRNNTSMLDTAQQVVLEDIYDLKAYFLGRVLVIDTTAYRITDADFVQDESRRFEILYELGGQKYCKILPGVGQSFFLSAQGIFSDDENYAGQDIVMKLYYHKFSSYNPQYIGTFTLVIGDKAHIIEELKVLNQLSAKKPAAFLYEEALPFLEMRYGKPHPQQVKRLLEEYLELEF